MNRKSFENALVYLASLQGQALFTRTTLWLSSCQVSQTFVGHERRTYPRGFVCVPASRVYACCISQDLFIVSCSRKCWKMRHDILWTQQLGETALSGGGPTLCNIHIYGVEACREWLVKLFSWRSSGCRPRNLCELSACDDARPFDTPVSIRLTCLIICANFVLPGEASIYRKYAGVLEYASEFYQTNSWKKRASSLQNLIECSWECQELQYLLVTQHIHHAFSSLNMQYLDGYTVEHLHIHYLMYVPALKEVSFTIWSTAAEYWAVEEERRVAIVYKWSFQLYLLRPKEVFFSSRGHQLG